MTILVKALVWITTKYYGDPGVKLLDYMVTLTFLRIAEIFFFSLLLPLFYILLLCMCYGVGEDS